MLDPSLTVWSALTLVRLAGTDKSIHTVNIYSYISVVDPDFGLRRGPGSILLAQPASLTSVISSFFTQNKEGPGPPDPSPRSATAFTLSRDEVMFDPSQTLGATNISFFSSP